MDRAAARTLVESSTGRTDKTTLINSALDLGVVKVSTARLWSQLRVSATASLLVDTSSVALASDAVRLTELRVLDGTSSYHLQLRAKEWVVRRWPLTSSLNRAKPAWGYLEGKTLHVVPEADKAYTIGYSYCRLHPALTDDSDPLLIDAADAAVVAYAIYWVWFSLEQPETATSWKAVFEDELADAIKADHSSATEIFLLPYNEATPVQPNYWLDPFVKTTP